MPGSAYPMRSVNAPCAGEMFAVELVVEIRDFYPLASFRRMDKPVVSDIDANMRHITADAEKQQVTGSGRIERDRPRGSKLFQRRSRYCKPCLTVGIENETATVEALRRSTAPNVGYADHLFGHFDDVCTCGGAWIGGTGIDPVAAGRVTFGVRARLRRIP